MGQAYVGFSDMLGDKHIMLGAGVYGTFADADLFFQYVNLGRRINWGFAAYQFRNDFLLSTAKDSDEFVSNIYRGGELMLSRPFDMFTRVEFGLQGVAVSRRVFEQQHYYDPDPVSVSDEGTVFYAAPSVALVKDTALYGSTGPIKGRRLRFEARQGLGGASFTDLTADLRRYVNIRHRYSLAGRLLGATSFGEDPQVYRVGGPFTIRAVDYGEMEGSNLALANLEFRFPFVDRLDLGWPLPLGLRGIRGVLFFDAGAAWGETWAGEDLTPAEREDQRTFTPFSREGGFHLEDLKAAYGFGVRMNLGFLLVRWDLAQATDLQRNIGPTKGYIALGAEF